MAITDPQIPSASADVVAIFLEEDGGPLVQSFVGAGPMRAQVNLPSQYMVHPLETGAPIIDHRVILPIEIAITFILQPETYRSTYQELRQAYLASNSFTVQTKADTYTGMYINNLPHEEEPELFDTIRVIVSFIEAQFFSAQVQVLSSANVTDPADASTLDRGEQIGLDPTDSQNDRGSILFRTFEGFFE